MTRSSPRRPSSPARLLRLAASLCALLLSVLGSCGGVESDRLRQYLNERGFGTRADGSARAENFVAGADEVQFIVDPEIYRRPLHEMLFLLQTRQPVSIDGTIYVPYVGQVYALGKTEAQLAAEVSLALEGVFKDYIHLDARIFSTGKGFYVYGEVEGASRWVPMPHGDLTVLEAIARTRITDLANLGRVRWIKPDARYPLVTVINVREILETGNTTFNVPIDHNDIIYIPPTFFGHIARFMEKLVQPIGAVTRAAFGLAGFRSTYDYLVYDKQSTLLFGGSRRF
ncbi:MAG: polysaccharide biosynthesis/export family protein [Planctomycetota bacterium]